MLVLDEPTNHLDVESREALEDALLAFEGAVILVSHDRALLEAVGSRTLVLADGELESHPVGWATYQREADERAAEASAVAAAKRSGNGAGKAKGPSKNALRRVRDLEAEVERAEAGLKELEEELANPDAWASPSSAERASERHQAAKAELERLMAEWEEAQVKVGAG